MYIHLTHPMRKPCRSGIITGPDRSAGHTAMNEFCINK